MPAFRRNNSLSTGNIRSEKCNCPENLCCYCKTKGYDMTWNSCSCQHFRHSNYHQSTGLLTNCSRENPLVIVTNIVTQEIVVALRAALVTNMTTETTNASQQLVTAKAKATMPNPATDLDQEHDCNQSCDSWSPRHDHGPYIHDDDNWRKKWTRSPVALSCLRSDHGTPPPQAKSPHVQHQDPIVELKTTAMPPQDNEAVPEYAAPTKIQRIPCATYPVHPPSPKDNWEYADNNDDNYDLPLRDMKVK